MHTRFQSYTTYVSELEYGSHCSHAALCVRWSPRQQELELSLEQLATMGLEVLHPEVILTPQFGQDELDDVNKVRFECESEVNSDVQQRLGAPHGYSYTSTHGCVCG